MASPRSPTPGALVISSRYRVERKLGSGSLGTVYLVRDEAQGSRLALKLLRPEILGEEALRSFQEEFQAIATLRHPRIASARDFGYSEGDGIPYYTREYIEGHPLPAGPPPLEGQRDPRAWLQPILDLLDALQYLHAQDILHLDIHAGNLIAAADESRGAVLIDFGLPRSAQTAAAARLISHASGLAPEILRGEPAEAAADIHAAGRLLLQRVTGRVAGENRLPREIPGWGSRLTLELERIIGKAMQPDPGQRFRSAQEMREALSSAVGGARDAAASGGRRGAPSDLRQLVVGRDAELRALDAALDQAAAGGTAVIWWTGPHGIGKTRLLTEARWRAQLRGLPTIEARFEPAPTPPPPLSKVLSARREGSGWLSPLSREHGGSSLERARRAAESFFSESGPPLVILVDDLDLADRESLTLTAALASECARRREAEGATRGLCLLVGSSDPPPPECSGGVPARRLRPLPARTGADLLAGLLKPISATLSFRARCAREAAGVPLRLRQIAMALREEYARERRIPDRAAVPPWSPPAWSLASRRARGAVDVAAIQTLAVLRRPASPSEIAAISGLPVATVARCMRKLGAAAVIVPTASGRERAFSIADPAVAERVSKSLPASRVRSLHLRAARRLQSLKPLGLDASESLSRHLLAGGRQREGREEALRTAARLREKGLLSRAVRLLEEASARETTGRWRLRIAEEISEIHGLSGDHPDGIAVLAPVVRARAGLQGAEAVRLLRRLGTHHHRAGQPERAVSLFTEALRLADPERDREEVITIHAELAELHNFRGEHEQAEEASRRGLDLLASLRRSSSATREEFCGPMEVTLRATLGHLELRRMNLEGARSALEEALALSQKHGTRHLRALILNNLGIAYNQLNRFARSVRCFGRAERLLAAAGDTGSLIHIACNLAIIAAKRGMATRAREEIAKAWRLLRQHAGTRLEFSVENSQAIVHHHLGAMGQAIAAFEKAISLARKLGDEYMVRFDEIYLAEAHLACGHYEEASRLLAGCLAHGTKAGPPVLARMAAARILFLESLLGRNDASPRARKALQACPRTRVELLEAWNDLFLAGARALAEARGRPGESGSAAVGADDGPRFDRLLEAFQTLGVPAGRRLALVGVLHETLRAGRMGRVWTLLRALEKEAEGVHDLLAAIEPLSVAEASFRLGELDRCERSLEKATGAMVSLPYPELDWRTELLRARVAERQGDRDAARHHLQRAVQTRDYVARSLPAGWRDSYASGPWFAALEALGPRLEAREAESTPLAGSEYCGMVGRSKAMRELFASIERVKHLDLPAVIVGESGTGKDLVAKALHRLGPRARAPFFVLSCASLPEALFESELFGHVAGAFTGAEESRPGLLAGLEGGTLVLDGILHLSLPTQAKILQVLDSRSARPLGGVEAHPVDVRFVSSSSKDLDAARKEGLLREDLYYRLAAIEIRLPPLRERLEDIPLLVDRFLELHGRRLERQHVSFSPRALSALAEHRWPGNVRELETVVIRLLVGLSPGTVVEPEHLRQHMTIEKAQSIFPEEILRGRSIEALRRELDRAYLLRLFGETGGDIPRMAKTLGMCRSNLYVWLRKVGLDVKDLRGGDA